MIATDTKLKRQSRTHLGTRFGRKPKLVKTYGWLRISTKTPEYTQYTEDDLDELVSWWYDYKKVKDEDREEFVDWLREIPLGKVVRIHQNYSLVRVELSSVPFLGSYHRNR